MKMDSIIDFLGFIVVKSFSILMWCTGLRPALWIGRRIGDIAYCANYKRRAIAYANLKAAFPEKLPKELKRINRAHFENLGMSIIELLKLPIMRKGYLKRHVELQNVDSIKSALSKGKGAILLTAHFGNWEISSLAASLNGYTMSVFAREQKYERLNNLLNEFRQSTGCRVITKGFSSKDIIKTLNNNGIVGMLSDQDAGANGVFVNFFNRPASMAQGPVVFGSRTGAAILPSFIWRVGTDKHIARAGDLFELKNTGNKENDIRENSQRIASILEGYVRRFPEQWLWSHKRWKSTPQRNVLVLTDGRPGHFNQAMAVAEMIEAGLGSRLEARGIGQKPIVKIQAVEVRFKNKFTKMLLDLASIFATKGCQGCLRCMRFCLTKESFENARNRYADIVISCGASTVAAGIFLKYENNAKNVVIMKPGFGRSKKIDLIILPRHDAISVGNGFKPFPTPNVLVTDGAPNRIEEAMKEVGTGQCPVPTIEGKWGRGIGVLIGGDAKGFRLEKGVVEKVLDAVLKISEEKDLDISIATSRRTSNEIDGLIKDKLSNNSHCRLLVIANEKNINGIVPEIFGLSSIIVTSPESISMISEAASSGKHVVVFRAETRNQKPETRKYDYMVSNLERQGYIKTAGPDEVYNTINQILEKRPEIKRMKDRERIIDRLKGIV